MKKDGLKVTCIYSDKNNIEKILLNSFRML